MRPAVQRIRWLLFVGAILVLAACGHAVPPTAPAGPTPSPTLLPPELADLTADQVATLQSLVQVDDYPLYTMHYQGTYAQVDEKVGGVPRAAGNSGWACSLFAALAEGGERVYGRNFDWEFSPALLLFTSPPGAYASVSLVDIAYLGFSGQRALSIAELPLNKRRPLLETPLWPFDGLNEKGLAVGMAAVTSGDVEFDPSLETVDSLSIIRLMLDQAATVDEALQLMQSYNVDFAGGPPLHYLLADRSGRAILVEYYRGEMQILPNDEPWHAATNFLLASAGDEPAGHCARYDLIAGRLAETHGQLDFPQALDLLQAVSQANTQWSVVYGLTGGEIQVVPAGRWEHIYRFHLDGAFQPDGSR